MFALIKYGVGCTLSIKHTLLDWSRKLWFEYWWPRFILFIIMFLHERACALFFRPGTPDVCRRVANHMEDNSRHASSELNQPDDNGNIRLDLRLRPDVLRGKRLRLQPDAVRGDQHPSAAGLHSDETK